MDAKTEEELYHELNEVCMNADVNFVTAALVRLLINAYTILRAHNQVDHLRASLARFVVFIDVNAEQDAGIAVAEGVTLVQAEHIPPEEDEVLPGEDIPITRWLH